MPGSSAHGISQARILEWVAISSSNNLRNINHLRYADDTTLITLTTQCVLVTQSCLTLYDAMDCSLPGSSVHGIVQARILEWVAFPFYRGSS